MSPGWIVRDLHIARPGVGPILRGIDLSVPPGASLAVVGESGSGKSTLAHALAGLFPDGGEVTGSVRVNGRELVGADQASGRRLRGPVVGLSVQGTPLNPVLRLEDQLRDVLKRAQSRAGADVIAARLAEVGLEPELGRRYPHEVSGGQRRRFGIALALALRPELLVLDEPTAGLDAPAADELRRLVGGLMRERGIGLVVVTHQLAEAVQLAAQTLVLYGGQVLEHGPSAAVLGRPRHPYTRDLVAAYPVVSTTRDLRPIRGAAPDRGAVPSGCPFHPRCPQVIETCRRDPVTLRLERDPVALRPERDRAVACHRDGVVTVLSARAVSYRHPGTRAGIAGVDLDLRSGEALAVVGPSGSGKSTLARVLARELAPQTGAVAVPAQEGDPTGGAARRRLVQLVRQDPWDALSPYATIGASLAEAIRLTPGHRGDVPTHRLEDAVRTVGLGAGVLDARPDQLAGGQLQRVNLARALLAAPRVIIADEPTSMLDPSEQARLMVVLRERQSELGIALVLVSHDLALVRKVTHRVLVLDSGRVVEAGPTERLCTRPDHPVTQRLLAAAPDLWAVSPSATPATKEER